jgi:hypothetical protein
VWGVNFGADEIVNLRIDSPTGPVIAAPVTDSAGSFADLGVPLPTPFPGGDHALYATGVTSGASAQSTVTVAPPVPSGFLSAAGLAWTYDGEGWVPGETVQVKFPDGAPVNQVADAVGSVTITVVSPPEPRPGDVVAITAPSFTTGAKYHVMALAVAPPTGEPKTSVPVSGTGYGPSETVHVGFDGNATPQALQTDALGSFSGSVILNLTFGRHTISFTGASSKVAKNQSILLAGTMALAPTSGPVGTTITIDSGPGWVPGETVHVKIGQVLVKDVTAGSGGGVHTTVVLTRHALGNVNLNLVGAVTATASFQVTAS